MVKVSASQPRGRVYEHYIGSRPLFDTSTGWFHDADSRVIAQSCDNLFHNRAKNKHVYYKPHIMFKITGTEMR